MRRYSVKQFNPDAASGRLSQATGATMSTADQVTVKMDKQFAPCPQGSQQAVAVDVIDLGETVESYQNEAPKKLHKVAIVFQSDEENPDTGKRFEPSVEFTASFGQRAKLRKFLGDWRGKPYTDEEALAGAPLHKLLGVNAILNVQHKTSGAGRVYAIIASIAPPMKNQPKIEPHNYTRSDHWERRKQEYAAKVAEFAKASAPPPPAAGAGANFDDLPASLQDDSDSLPF